MNNLVDHLILSALYEFNGCNLHFEARNILRVRDVAESFHENYVYDNVSVAELKQLLMQQNGPTNILLPGIRIFSNVTLAYPDGFDWIVQRRELDYAQLHNYLDKYDGIYTKKTAERYTLKKKLQNELSHNKTVFERSKI